MVQRRDTLGFVEFMRGRRNIKYLQVIKYDKVETKILNNLIFLWQNLWMNKNLKNFNEYNTSKKKFNLLKKT